MQSFSPPMLALAASAPLSAAPDLSAVMEAMQAGRLAVPWWLWMVNFLLGVLSIWVSSKLFAGERATIGRALLLIVGWTGVGIVLGLILGLGMVVVMAKASAGGAVVVGLLFLLLFLVSIVAVPSVVYEINALKSIGFVVVYLVLACVSQLGFHLLMFGVPQFDPQRFRTAMVRARPTPEDPEDVRARLRERQGDLYRRYEQLEIHRLHLPPGDWRERGRYEREKADYEADLADLREEAAKLPPP
jgi:hypothetical protein